MSEQSENPKQRNNSALVAMALVLRHKNKRVSINEVKQQFTQVAEINDTEMQRGLQDMHVRSRWLKLQPKKIASYPWPGVVSLNNGDYAVVVQANDEQVLLQRYGESRAEPLSYSDFLAQINGQVLLLTADEDAETLDNKSFGFRWFFKTIFKYRSVMRETLLASFFIQLFALITPLFFMIVIDKVFAHNNLSTLNVLVFAMVVVAIFDVLLNAARTYLMSHTTNRVDMELAIRTFKHMMQLPLSYFETRKTGETIARMKELESIRNFLTGSTLTLLIDLLFLIVFLVVMYLFSPTLFLIVMIALPLFFLVSYAVTPLMKDKLEDKHEKMAQNQSFMVETIGGIETIKSSSTESHCQKEFEDRMGSLAKCSVNSSALSNVINQTTTLISKGLTVALLFTGAHLVIAGDLSVGQLIAFNMLTGRVIQPIQRLAQIWQEFTGMRVSMQRVADIRALKGYGNQTIKTFMRLMRSIPLMKTIPDFYPVKFNTKPIFYAGALTLNPKQVMCIQ